MLTSLCSGTAGAPWGRPWVLLAPRQTPPPRLAPMPNCAQLCPAGAPSGLALGQSCPQTARTQCPWDQVEAHVSARPSSLSGLSPRHTHAHQVLGAIAGHANTEASMTDVYRVTVWRLDVRARCGKGRPFSLGPHAVRSPCSTPWGAPPHVLTSSPYKDPSHLQGDPPSQPRFNRLASVKSPSLGARTSA